MNNADFSDIDIFGGDPIRPRVYKAVAEQYQIKTACYPACGNDVAPSLHIPHVTYIDNASDIQAFFDRRELLQQVLDVRKTYPEPCTFRFLAHNYECPLDLPEFDLLISQYAGHVGQLMKHHLRCGGILLVEAGCDDAKLALEDSDYVLLGTVRTLYRTEAVIEPGLQPIEYFSPPNDSFPFSVPMARNLCFKKVSGSKKWVK